MNQDFSLPREPFRSPEPAPQTPPSAPLSPTPQEADVRLDPSIVDPLFRVRGWMRLLGWVQIIGGAMYCLSIVGILFAWLPIWIGVTLLQAADRLERGVSESNEAAIQESFIKIALLFTIAGVLTAIWLVVMGLVVAGMILAALIPLMQQM